jgi:3-oxo-5-alpha-steroid 4-dehydrogenase 1
MGLVHDGGAGLPHTTLHYVYSAVRTGTAGFAADELGYGRHVCASSPSPLPSVSPCLDSAKCWRPQTIHYLYRAIASPLFLNPSMSPIHPLVWAAALLFQIFNSISLGGWLAGYGPTTLSDWAGRLYTIEIGMVIWGWSLLLNMYHDDDLREIRRAALRRQRKEAEEKAKAEGKEVQEVRGDISKVYMLPKNGLFHFVLFPHYLCEWFEWAGFWMVGGWGCTPARSFLFNEISAMLPRALQGWDWYVEEFGREKVGSRKAIIPGLL